MQLGHKTEFLHNTSFVSPFLLSGNSHMLGFDVQRGEVELLEPAKNKFHM